MHKIWIELNWNWKKMNWKILNPIWIWIELNWKILNSTWIGIELNWMKWIDPSPGLDIGNLDYEGEWLKKLKTVYTSLKNSIILLACGVRIITPGVLFNVVLILLGDPLPAGHTHNSLTPWPRSRMPWYPTRDPRHPRPTPHSSHSQPMGVWYPPTEQEPFP